MSTILCHPFDHGNFKAQRLENKTLSIRNQKHVENRGDVDYTKMVR